MDCGGGRNVTRRCVPNRLQTRRRKTIRSNEITPDFVQINARVTAYGDKSLDELFPKVAGEKAEKPAKSGKR